MLYFNIFSIFVTLGYKVLNGLGGEKLVCSLLV